MRRALMVKRTAMKSALFASGALLLLACETTKVDPAPPAASSPAPTNAPVVTKPATPGKVDPVEEEVASVTKAWNDALAKRDAKALEPLYAANVRLYTVEMTREKAVKTKSDILGAAKDYTQSISFLEIDTRKKTQPRALFNKKWTQNGKEAQVRASLVFVNEGGKWVIKEESDAPSDQRRARAAQNADGCESSVMRLASSTPEAMRILGGPTDPAKGHLSNGSRIGGGPPEQATYSIGIHENHTDRIVTLMWIDVDPKTGAMTDGILNTPLQGSADLVEKVKVACAAASR
jgi:hypothetical protein